MSIFKYNNNWSIDIIDDWKYQIQNDCVSIFNDNGYGVLQISTYLMPIVLDNENIKSFIPENDFIRSKLVSCGDFNGFTIKLHDDEGSLWRKWWVTNDKVLLFITYNCSLEDQLFEQDNINRMLLSLRAFRLAAL